MTGLTRIAPTPSGFLHVGNLVNFALVALTAQQLDLEILLRIDDGDAGRLREQYTEDIYRVCEFFSYPIAHTAKSQLERTDAYWQAVVDLADAGAPIFVCTCSRAQMPNRVCERNCDGLLADFTPIQDRVRIRHDGEDVTLWGREHPSYHLVSTVDDRDYGVTHVVRGGDLAPSTQIHKMLNTYLGHSALYAHHELLVDAQGNKLSKSQGTQRLALDDDLRKIVQNHAERLLPSVLAQFA